MISSRLDRPAPQSDSAVDPDHERRVVIVCILSYVVTIGVAIYACIVLVGWLWTIVT